MDPQGQGKNWIKTKNQYSDLQITNLNHKYFRTHLEDSLSLGRPLLIEDVAEELLGHYRRVEPIPGRNVVLTLDMQLQEIMLDAFAEHDVRPAHFGVLATLDDLGALCQRDLCDRSYGYNLRDLLGGCN